MNQGSNQKQGNRYQVMLLLLVGLAALSNMAKDLDRLQQFAGSLQQTLAGWTDSSLPTVSAAGLARSEAVCKESLKGNADGQEFRWHGRVAAGKAIEIKGLHGDVIAEPGSGDEIEVVANKTSKNSDINLVSIKVLEHAEGVTICAVYPTEDPKVFTPCRPSRIPVDTDRENYPSEPQVLNNDVRVNFRIKVPAGVDFMARTINGDISAESMASNVAVKTVNGSIRVSTSGYADAKTVNGEISAKLGNANWSGSINFKTVNGEINLELPASLSAVINAKTFHGEISSDFPLTSMSKFSKKQFTGTIGNGGRELNLKTLNGSINLRRVG
jgi:putative adhesin